MRQRRIPAGTTEQIDGPVYEFRIALPSSGAKVQEGLGELWELLNVRHYSAPVHHNERHRKPWHNLRFSAGLTDLVVEWTTHEKEDLSGGLVGSGPGTYVLFTDGIATVAGTRPVPTGATEGMDLSGVESYRVTVSAALGQTLSGTGELQGWLYDPDLARWAIDPDLTFPITASGITWSNVRDRASPDFAVGVRQGRVVWRANGVGTSSGEVTVTIKAKVNA